MSTDVLCLAARSLPGYCKSIRPVSAAFVEYLETIAALTGSPFLWGDWRAGCSFSLRSRHARLG